MALGFKLGMKVKACGWRDHWGEHLFLLHLI